MREKLPNHWQCLARIGQLPPHQHDQGKTEEQKKQPGKSVLDADHLVIGGENIFSPPPELVMLMLGVLAVRVGAGFERSGSIHFRKTLALEYRDRKAQCKAGN